MINKKHHSDSKKDTIKEFSWSQYQQDIVSSRIKKHGTIKNAIVTMDAQISALEAEIEVLQGMANWSEEE